MFADAPNVTMSASQTTLTELKDSLTLNCAVDANPAASITWYKDLEKPDQAEEVGTGPSINIR